MADSFFCKQSSNFYGPPPNLIDTYSNLRLQGHLLHPIRYKPGLIYATGTFMLCILINCAILYSSKFPFFGLKTNGGWLEKRSSRFSYVSFCGGEVSGSRSICICFSFNFYNLRYLLKSLILYLGLPNAFYDACTDSQLEYSILLSPKGVATLKHSFTGLSYETCLSSSSNFSYSSCLYFIILAYFSSSSFCFCFIIFIFSSFVSMSFFITSDL